MNNPNDLTNDDFSVIEDISFQGIQAPFSLEQYLILAGVTAKQLKDEYYLFAEEWNNRVISILRDKKFPALEDYPLAFIRAERKRGHDILGFIITFHK